MVVDSSRPVDIRHARTTFQQISNTIRSTIVDDLNNADAYSTHDSIHECGSGPLSILLKRPKDVLELARDKTYQWPFKDVPQCWLRLCEDASLLLAGESLGECTQELAHIPCDNSLSLNSKISKVLSQVVETIDHGIALSGQPRRKALSQQCLDALQTCSQEEYFPEMPTTFDVGRPPQLGRSQEVSCSQALSFEDFQSHLDSSNTPLVMSGALVDWPALVRWQHPHYLLSSTLGGRRLALVEIGSSYADAGLRQELMSISKFLTTFMCNTDASEIGYIAQHDLLGHITRLSKDVLTPEYCYTSPPPVQFHSNSVMLDHDPDTDLPPRRNVWIGPKGTRSPFHTDPDANLYCQVVGYKYFRLIAADQEQMMYPRGGDANGLDLSNQSRVVDFSFDHRNDSGSLNNDFPLFAKAAYQEVILGPGDCLYIPTRCWHFAESLSASIGVNFWWT